MQLPRWEWRTFAPSLRKLHRRLAGAEPRGSKVGDETCLLCLRSSHQARIHGGILDLSWRKQVHPDGPELWDAVLRSGFPCTADFIHRLFHAWDIEPIELEGTSFSAPQFLTEVADRHPALRPLAVHRLEEAFSLDGAACTFERIRTGGLHLEGFRIEHEDPALICDALHDLGLDGHDNVNYPEALKRALGLIPA